MADNPRIEELRRRVLADPASIAFAALAEEYRRTGNYAEAIETCRTGLQRHPSYLSARVTLGRALMEISQYDEARKELELVLKSAPENLAAIRGLAEIHERQGSLPETDFMHMHVEAAAESPEPAVPAAAVALDSEPVATAAPAPADSFRFEPPVAPAIQEPLPVLAAAPLALATPEPVVAPQPVVAPEPIVAPVPLVALDPIVAPAAIPAPDPIAAPDPVVARLEQFLVAIQSARTSAHVSR